jgi:hypothetical protein
MAMYLTRFSYTPETWARMIETSADARGRQAGRGSETS